MSELTRREWLACLGASVAVACSRASSTPAIQMRPAEQEPSGEDPLTALESRIEGRVGVFALDSSPRAREGALITHREDERFAMCSTFKWALAAAVLARIDRGEVTLHQTVAYRKRDLLHYSPATRAHLGEGGITVESLAEAAVTVSDNTAANLLLALVGGPAGLTQYLRGIGDLVTRLDRDEPMLNTNHPGDPRDTTSPRAMATTMQAVLTGSVLSTESRQRLLSWLLACTTGAERLRSGFPRDWRAGDKTGTGKRGSHNDVAIVWPPGQSPILVASYLDGSSTDPATLNAAHAEIGRLVASRVEAR
ncbi:MAG: class A beta-lactamase [Polyangiaceae bacterium]|nr:class A beta-lactamase [Polyangiaceae bacterium]